MMNKIWFGLMALGILWGILTGKADEVTIAAVEGSATAIQTMLTLAAGYALWMGMMRILEKSGGTRLLQRALTPVIRFLFPGVERESAAEGYIATNLSANMLGLGNAATPAGLSAMGELAKRMKNGVATDDMCMFLSVNCSSLQLIPTTLIALRASYGAPEPGAILVPVLICTAASTAAAVLGGVLLRRRSAR